MNTPLADRLRIAVETIVSSCNSHVTNQTFAPRSVLVARNESPTYVFILTKGLAGLTTWNGEGHDSGVCLRAAGAALGAAAALLDQPQPCSIEAITRCEARAIPSRLFRERVTGDLGVCGATLLLTTMETLTDNARIGELQSARRRIEQILTALGRELGTLERSGWLRFALPLSCENLAALAGVAPETLSRTMAQLEREARLERGRGWLRLRSPAGRF